MTKLEAIQGLLSGQYSKVKARNFTEGSYIFMKDNTMFYKNNQEVDVYSDMTNMDDVSWDEAHLEWYKNIPDTGVLVFVESNVTSVKRAVKFDGSKIIFDDETSADLDKCSLLTREESETLHKTTFNIS